MERLPMLILRQWRRRCKRCPFQRQENASKATACCFACLGMRSATVTYF